MGLTPGMRVRLRRRAVKKKRECYLKFQRHGLGSIDLISWYGVWGFGMATTHSRFLGLLRETNINKVCLLHILTGYNPLLGYEYQ